MRTEQHTGTAGSQPTADIQTGNWLQRLPTIYGMKNVELMCETARSHLPGNRTSVSIPCDIGRLREGGGLVEVMNLTA